MEVTSHHAEAVGEGAGISVEERLLFHGIALRSSGVSPGNEECATAVEADFADSGLAFRNGTAVAAGETAQAIVFELLDQARFGLADVRVEDGAKGGHRKSVFILTPQELASDNETAVFKPWLFRGRGFRHIA